MFDTRPCEAHIISPLPTFRSVHISSISPRVSSPQAQPSSTSLPRPDERLDFLFCDSTFVIGEMAQRTEKEETEFKVPETISLCVNNCGLTGNPATNNMCQKCFNATATSTTAAASAPSLKFTGEKSPRSLAPRSPQRSNSPGLGGVSTKQTTDLPKPEESARREVNRCNGCRKRVGLTGFRCRCGDLFCSEHRYSDRHDCSYDYKAAGRETIARENPVVRAAKIVRV